MCALQARVSPLVQLEEGPVPGVVDVVLFSTPELPQEDPVQVRSQGLSTRKGVLLSAQHSAPEAV